MEKIPKFGRVFPIITTGTKGPPHLETAQYPASTGIGQGDGSYS